MPDPNESSGMIYKIAPDVIRVAAARVCGSQVFQMAKQQEVLLRFLVDEYLAGRAKQGSRDAVVSKFYEDRPEEEAAQKLIWAMSRLSEKLAEYYDGDGADDPIRIFVDRHNCGLQFEMWEADTAPHAAPVRKPPARILVIVGALLAVAIGWAAMELMPTGVADGPQAGRPSSFDLLTDGAELPFDPDEMSVAGLIDEARTFQYPMLDLERQKVAIALSKEAVARAPENAKGYATAAYSLAVMANFTTGGALSRRYLQEAMALNEQAMSLAPDDSWVKVSAAVVALAEQDYEVAMDLSKAGYASGQEDGFVAHTYATIAQFTGQFEEVLIANAPDSIDPEDPIKLIRERIYAFARFHVGDYKKTIQVIEAGTEAGEAHNISSMLYLAAAYQAVNDHEQASALVSEIQTNWPTLRTDLVPSMFFHDPDHAEVLVQHLSAAGMSF